MTEFKHKITGETHGAHPGSALEEAYLGDPLYREISGDADLAPAPAAGTTLGDLNVAQLKKVAKERGIDIGDARKKVELIAKIEAGPGLPTPNPHDLVPSLNALTDEQLDEVVDLLEIDGVADEALRETVIEALLAHEDQGQLTEAIETATAE